MKKQNLVFPFFGLLIISVVLFMANSYAIEDFAISAETTETTIAQTSSTDEPFDLMMAVLTHKRCVNCHPAGNQPHQGEDSHVHQFDVQRGAANMGVDALSCNACHREENNDYSGVPGAPDWALAPIEMAWEGLNRVEIARSMLNPAKNGGRTLEETVEHLTEHALVLWAWNPGIDAAGNEREKPPVPVDQYIAAVKEWAENGAPIPEK